MRSAPAARQDRDLLRRMVGRDLAQAGDRLDGRERPRVRAQDRRPDDRAAALVRRPHLDQRGAGILDGAARNARPYQAIRRTIDVAGDGTNNSGRDINTVRDEILAKGVTINGLVILSETPAAVEPGAHQPARRARRILPPQRDRRAGLVRHGGGRPQFVRPGHHQEDDRRDRLGAAAGCVEIAPLSRCHAPRRRGIQ